jgi:hypothetical protein
VGTAVSRPATVRRAASDPTRSPLRVNLTGPSAGSDTQTGMIVRATRISLRGRRTATIAATVVAILAGPTSAHAGSSARDWREGRAEGPDVTAATCTVDKPVTIKPGFLFFPATFSSDPGGTVVCEGIIDNRVLAGPADLSFFGVIAALNSLGCPVAPRIQFDGAGTLDLHARTLPLGSITVSGAFAFTRHGPEIALVGSASGSVLTGSLVFRRQGLTACLDSKSISARVTGQIALVDS